MGFKIRTSSDNSTDKGCHSINWSFKKIKDIAPLQRGFDLPASQIIKGEYPVCYSNGIANYHNEYKVEGPGVFTGRSGTIGNVFYVKENFWPHNTTLWVTDFKNNDEKFIYYLYQQVKLERFNAGTGVPTLNRNDVHDYKVLVPTNKEEQQKIAKILSTWDKAIELKERLIEQKKEQKKGLMQKLLTGEVRLPGFDGEWEEVKLEQVVDRVKGKAIKYSEDGLYPAIDMEYLESGIFRNYTDDDSVLANKNDVLLLWDGSRAGRAFTGIKGSVGSTFVKLTCKEINNLFLQKHLELNEKKIQRLREGSGIPHVPKDFLSFYKIKIPKMLEQEAIAKVLLKVDKNILLMENEVVQLKAQKKGLMQLLLTGKVRVQV